MPVDRFLSYVEKTRTLTRGDYVRCARMIFFCDLTPDESRIVRRAIRLQQQIRQHDSIQLFRQTRGAKR